jgi:cytochrome c biogenesis protein
VKQVGRKTQVAGLAKNGIPGLAEEVDQLVKGVSNDK